MIVAVGGVLAVAALWWVRVRDNGGNRIDWVQDLPTAEAAAAGGKPMLLDFMTEWCPACEQMKRTTWADRATAAAVADRTVPVRVDCDRHKDLEQKYAIQVLPTLMLVAADGRELRRVEGFQTTDGVCRLLNRVN